MINLQKFCAPSDRPYVVAPFSRGDWSYATNGHVAVRIARVPIFQELAPGKPDIERLFKDAEATEYRPLRPLQLIGSKEVAVKCWDCHGGHKHACPSCACVCDKCGGSGSCRRTIDLGANDFSVGINGAAFNGSYIALMQSLPGIAVAAAAQDMERPMLFRFEHGYGVITPMRAQFPHHIEEPQE